MSTHSQRRNGQPAATFDELVGMLSELGLTLNESRVYIGLLESESATAAELSAETGVPRPKVYEALASLESYGFAASSGGGHVKRFSAISPGLALRAWVRFRDQERAAAADHDAATSEIVINALPQPIARPIAASPGYMQAISGRLPTSEALETLIASCQESLVMMTQPPFVQPRPRWNVEEVRAVERGVDVRIIYTPAALSDEKRYVDFVRAGGQAGVLPELPMKLLVRDGAEALISLRDATTGEQSVTSARIQHPDLVMPLTALFEDHWRRVKRLQRNDLA